MEININQPEKAPFSNLEGKDKEELNKYKLWLFGENIRLENLRKELKKRQDDFLTEKMQFNDEMRILNRQIVVSQNRLKQDQSFFQKKMDILQNGFQQLDMDRRKFEKEKRDFQSEHNNEKYENHFSDIEISLLFRGVTNIFTLKKRYRDLVKIYHPDNLAGDKEVIYLIREEYERLQNKFISQADREA